MKVAVWGCNGILGSYITKNLPFDVVGVSRQTIDITNNQEVKQYLQSQQFNIVINCATKGNGKVTDFCLDHVINNLTIYNNLYTCQDLYGRLINISSGAEFDKTRDIFLVNEKHIFNRNPMDSYGLSKNIIARRIHVQDNAYNLRLFGCFHNTEHPSRFFATIARTKKCIIERDCMFDFVSACDFTKVLDKYISLDETQLSKDINIVYSEKETLATLGKMFCDLHFPNVDVIVKESNGLNYIGNSTRLDAFCERTGLQLSGLKKSLENYFN
jgi:dTDP-4-dehydrorhamnose reductase